MKTDEIENGWLHYLEEVKYERIENKHFVGEELTVMLDHTVGDNRHIYGESNTKPDLYRSINKIEKKSLKKS